MNNQRMVRYLLPDEQICEYQTDDLLYFVQLLQTVNSLSLHGVRYRVLETELVLDVTLWLMVTLEEGRGKSPDHSHVKEWPACYRVQSALREDGLRAVVH